MSIPTQRKPDYKSAWIFPILGIIAAFTYALLIFPNSFAPAGVGGISTMLQYALKVDAGILNLIINVPILITDQKPGCDHQRPHSDHSLVSGRP